MTHGDAAGGEIRVVIETDKGKIRLRLFADRTPITCANFINLARRGYYDNLTFHRVIPDFMVQGGCPQGDGRGGPGYQFEDECTPDLRHDKPGRLSMANAGPGTNGSQFFITHVPTPHLDDLHTVFGEVVDQADQSVVDSIAQGDRIDAINLEGDTTTLAEKAGPQIEQWNATLDRSFPGLRQAE